MALVRDARLVTLTGPGGIGKTSLAIEAARALAPRFRDGAWFVSLATVDGPEQVRAAIAHGIGLFDGPERPAASAAAVVPRRQVDDPRPRQHGAPAGGGGRGRRGRPRVAGQSRHRDQPRAAAHRRGARGPGRAAGRRRDRPLHRAGAGRPAGLGTRRRRRGGRRDLSTCWTTCRSASSSPPPASRRCSPTVIRDRLAARLPLPGSGLRDAPARQRTLEGAVAWSHDLLAPDRQDLLHRLGVFEGGFDLEQVDAVAGPSDGGRRSISTTCSSSPTRA